MFPGADRRAGAVRFLKFCAVGGMGFLADTGILLALVHLGGMNPIAAKVLSFGVAVLLTFELNRHWAFGSVRQGTIGRAFMAYLAVQGTGFVCNLCTFTLWVTLLPSPLNGLLPGAVVASAAALLLNYVGAKRLVFGIKPVPLGE